MGHRPLPLSYRSPEHRCPVRTRHRTRSGPYYPRCIPMPRTDRLRFLALWHIPLL